MQDVLTGQLLGGAHTVLVSGLWVLGLTLLAVLVVRCLLLALYGHTRLHPLVWLTLGAVLWAVLLIVWIRFQPTLVWGLMALGLPAIGVLSRTLRPRPRRYRSRF